MKVLAFWGNSNCTIGLRWQCSVSVGWQEHNQCGSHMLEWLAITFCNSTAANNNDRNIVYQAANLTLHASIDSLCFFGILAQQKKEINQSSKWQL
jgi:hypothetical protein